MTHRPSNRVLSIIACGAGPASEIGTLVKLAQDGGWEVQLIATPAALDFLDTAPLEKQTGTLVRSTYQKPGQRRSRPADAIIVAPATYNTINKWANGISDTYALGILAESLCTALPVVVLPFVNSDLAGRLPFRRSVDTLRSEGAQILLGPGGFEPHPPRTGSERIASFPWHLALDAIEHLLTTAQAAR